MSILPQCFHPHLQMEGLEMTLSHLLSVLPFTQDSLCFLNQYVGFCYTFIVPTECQSHFHLPLISYIFLKIYIYLHTETVHRKQKFWDIRKMIKKSHQKQSPPATSKFPYTSKFLKKLKHLFLHSWILRIDHWN